MHIVVATRLESTFLPGAYVESLQRPKLYNGHPLDRRRRKSNHRLRPDKSSHARLHAHVRRRGNGACRLYSHISHAAAQPYRLTHSRWFRCSPTPILDREAGSRWYRNGGVSELWSRLLPLEARKRLFRFGNLFNRQFRAIRDTPAEVLGLE